MAYVKEYWEHKKEHTDKAIMHTHEMERMYPNEIKIAIEKTKIFNDFDLTRALAKCTQQVSVVAEDSVSAIFSQCSGKTAVLNFASYKNPGGKFIEGSCAQEECLCHESFLYNVLKEFVIEYYDWNDQHKNKALYLNRALYTPDVIFSKDGKTQTCDVITCAAPNKSAAQKYQSVTNKENLQVLKSRIKFIMKIAADRNVDTLILGAFGCGVFGQDAMEVATVFKEFLSVSEASKIVFAIPDGKNGNLAAFRKVFK